MDLLIALVRDHTARWDERDDAAMDLGASDDPRALATLLEVASHADDDENVLEMCGTSIAEIAVRTSRFERPWLDRLASPALREVLGSLRAERPDLLEGPRDDS